MGLLNRLLGRGPAVDDWTWQPDGQGAIQALGDDMEDDGCASDEAFGVMFTLAAAPGATITAWFYPVYAPDDVDIENAYVIGVRADYSFDYGDGRPPWAHTQYAEDAEWIVGIYAATESAQEIAETLAAAPRTGPSYDDWEFFDWDGQPLARTED